MNDLPPGAALRRVVENGVVRCPGDGGPLEWSSTVYRCRDCGTPYPVHGGVLLDARPRLPRFQGEPGGGDKGAYLKVFHEAFTFDAAAMAWGAAETNPPWWVADKKAQAEAVCRLLLAHNDGDVRVACDVSAGAGHAVTALAARFETVIHADLCVRSLNYAIAAASRHGLANVAFVRADLLLPPFAGSVTNVVCLDTLEYGRAQMEDGLAAIRGALAPRGLAVVDFHNWWRNPVRRLGLMPANFPAGGSLSRREAEDMIARHGFDLVAYEGWRGRYGRGAVLRRALATVLAPARHTFAVRRASAGSGATRQGAA